MTEHPVGTMTHYFGKVQVDIVSLTDDIAIGDTLQFRGGLVLKVLTLIRSLSRVSASRVGSRRRICAGRCAWRRCCRFGYSLVGTLTARLE